MIMIEYNLLFSVLIFTVHSIYTTPPLWLTSNYFRAANQDVILGLTNFNTTPTPNHNFTFSSPLTGTPNLGYGIKAYEGTDYLGQQIFQVNRTYLDRFEFRVVVKIKGNTNIIHLNVPYIAIDPSFPHHVNSFDNVPVNYSAGNIVNISVRETSFKTYTNVINYTLQAAGSNYNTFLPPYSRNKVLLFMTSILFRGQNQINATLYPINITVSADVVSSSEYKIHVQVGYAFIYIQLLHFSIIVFDQTDVESSGLYVLVYDKITLSYTGGFIPIPAQFKNNFIMGMLSFTANKTRSIVDFQWNFSIVNGTHGVFMPLSVAVTNLTFGNNPIQTVTYTLFYIKTWICPNQTYFDPNQNLCSGCPIINCLNCFNISVCQDCDQLNDYFLNVTDNHCIACTLQGCTNCTNLTNCQQCNSSAGYSLLPNGTCFLCISLINNFFNNSTMQCETCTIPNCQICLNLTHCSQCNATNLYYVNSGSTCSYCDPNAGYTLLSNNTCFLCSSVPNNFLNPTTNNCEMCNLTGCQTCFNLTSCSICNQSSLYYMDTDSNCSFCDPTAGYSLLSNGTCFLCSSIPNHFLNQTTYECEVCSLIGCQICFNLTSCSVCDYNNSYYLSSNTTCSQCNKLNHFLNLTTLTCQQCNIIGCIICSTPVDCSVCDTGKGYYLNDTLCYNCTYFDNCSTLIEGKDVQTSRTGCNTFIFKYNLSQSKTIIVLDDLYFANQGLTLMGLQIKEEILQGNVSYSRDIYKQKLQLVIPSLSQTIVFQYNPLLPSLYFTQQQCKTKQNVQKLMEGIQIASYIILFISLLSCKIVGLQLFGVLQLAYISLASYDFYDMYLYPLTQFKSFNGLSISLFSQQSFLPSHLRQMKLSSNFVNNCNIMLILLLVQLLVALVLYMISKLTMSSKIRTVSLHLLKQGFITLIFFNILNISFSTGIQFKYSQTNGTIFIINVFIIVVSFIFILGSTLALQVTNPTQYGQYKNKFIDNWVCKLYIPISFVYRICLGLFIALKNDYEYATLLIISLSFLFIMYNIINLPFINPIQNYRCNLAHITNLITLFSANYYRTMKKNTPMDIKGRDHSVAILQLVMLVLTLVASIAVLVYEICHDLREYLKKRKISMQNKKIKNSSQPTIQDIFS